ncbi:MAG: DNA methyltransferase, partial [Coleofasciculaceae cyanobacterium RL_1_1]|nr:DNA methyltransferase [Coleofasciculaceae cyanobacterium RL_1_1]
TITKPDIFHYTYAILHHPAYRQKYEINLKRDFPRLPLYANFHQWKTWGEQLLDWHIHYETIPPHGLQRHEIDHGKKPKPAYKAKLKADKTNGQIILDTETILTGIPPIAWTYKLGNRSAIEWVLDQHKEKTPKDPTIRQLFNTYRFIDYKDHVIDLLDRVCTVSIKTMETIAQMPDDAQHQPKLH